MKKFFTRIIVFSFVTLSLQLTGQTFFRTVVGTANPVTLNARQANFGRDVSAQPLGETSVALVSTTGLCAAQIPASVSGKIALIERTGNLTCNASYIAYKAQVAGAVAVVFINENSTFVRNLPTRDSAVNATSSTIFYRSSSVNDSSSFVTIPVVNISKVDGDKLKTDLLSGNTVNGSIGFNTPSENRVVWGANGEGTFNGGPNGWVTSTDAADPLIRFDWVSSSEMLRPTYTPGINTTSTNGALRSVFMDSKTYRNGYMVLDAVYHQYRTGTPGAPPYPRFGASLESPIIDLSTVTKPVVLTFWSKLRELNSPSAQVQYSIDNGTTWKTAASVQKGVANNANVPMASEYQRVKLPGANGNSQVKIKFVVDLDFYFWGIDDIQIVEVEDYNLAFANNFASRSTNLIYPSGQMDTINFVADVTNIGGLAQSPIVYAGVFDAAGNLLHLDSLAYPSMNYNDSITDRLFPQQFYQNLPDGQYSVEYLLVGTGADPDLSDNSYSFPFVVGGDVFQKTADDFLTNAYRPGSTTFTNWGWGNAFYVVNKRHNPNIGRMIADTIFTDLSGVANMPLGSEIQARIYKVLAPVDTVFQTVTAAERELVAVSEPYAVTKTETSSVYLGFDMVDAAAGSGKYVMEDHTQYIAIIEMSRASVTDTMCYVRSSDGDPNYSGMVAGSSYAEQNPVRLGQVLYIGTGSGATEDFNAVGFGYDVIPSVHLVARQTTATNNPLPSSAKFNVFPTIASEYINLEFEFSQPQEGNFEISDMNGKRIASSTFKSQQIGLEKMDVKNLANGSYFVTIITKEGFRTFKFIVQH